MIIYMPHFYHVIIKIIERKYVAMILFGYRIEYFNFPKNLFIQVFLFIHPRFVLSYNQ